MLLDNQINFRVLLIVMYIIAIDIIYSLQLEIRLFYRPFNC